MFRQIRIGLRRNNGRLQLTYSHEGTQYYISLRLADTPENREAAAGAKLKLSCLVSAAVESGSFDHKHISAQFWGRGDRKAQAKASLSLPELWERYYAYKRSTLAANTQRTNDSYTRTLANCPYGFEAPVELRAWALENLTRYRAMRWLMELSACCRWGIDQGLVTANPFASLQVAKPKNDRGRRARPFSAQEVAKIVTGFESHPRYKAYGRLVRFLFLTGCRPGEALALRWGDISSDGKSLTFSRSAVTGPDYRIGIQEGLKRELQRTIPTVGLDEVPVVLDALGPPGGAEDLVFPSPSGGGIINWGNFTNRVWRKVLSDVGVEYRSGYKARHTFASEAITQMSPQEVAALIGNNPQTTWQYYVGLRKNPTLPTILPPSLS